MSASRPATSRDFCERWGKDHDFAVMLDADSVMTVDLLLKLVRIMQIDPRLGILQSLVIGMPSASAFARIFQFGMRLGMRSYTIGSAWWQGDCGPYWGHNAIVRIAPFMAHCELPVLTDRRAGERSCAQPRPGRGGADAARRLRGARAGRGRLELRAESAHPGRIHPPRSALVPGQHAVLAFSAHARPAAREPLPARVRDADVPRLAGVDRVVAVRHARRSRWRRRRPISCDGMRASRCSSSCW